MPPAYVKPYVKRNKTDAADAETICEAVTRPTMRYVPVKTAEQQADGMVLRTREMLMRQRSQTANALRAHVAELGILASAGMASIAKLPARGIGVGRADRRPTGPRRDLVHRRDGRRRSGEGRACQQEDVACGP